MANHEKILERVQKMLNLANDAGASEGERDNALRMAHATLAKYNLELADVESHNNGKEARGEPREEDYIKFYGRPWARHCAKAVGELFFCSYLYMSASRATDTKHYFVGRHSNVATACLMSEFVVQSIMKEGKREQRRHRENNAWLREFCWGAARTIQQRVKEIRLAAEKQSEEASDGKALVLASVYDKESAANLALRAQLHPRLRSGRGGKGHGMGEAYSRGVAYGKTVPLGKQVGGKAQKQVGGKS